MEHQKRLVYVIGTNLINVKIEHDLQALQRDKTAAVNFVANLEKMHDWIADENK